jgi:hypothetical protein
MLLLQYITEIFFMQMTGTVPANMCHLPFMLTRESYVIKQFTLFCQDEVW